MFLDMPGSLICLEKTKYGWISLEYAWVCLKYDYCKVTIEAR